MPFYALTDSDWPWDDRHEGRAIVVEAADPKEAVVKATDILFEEEYPQHPETVSGGITWKVAILCGAGFQSVEWEDGVREYDDFVTYDEPNQPVLPDKASVMINSPTKVE